MQAKHTTQEDGATKVGRCSGVFQWREHAWKNGFKSTHGLRPVMLWEISFTPMGWSCLKNQEEDCVPS